MRIQKKLFMCGILTGIIFLIIGTGQLPQAKANQLICPVANCFLTPTLTITPVNDCDNDGDSLSDTITHETTECGSTTPTPTETPMLTPSVTPEATPTATMTPVPTDAPSMPSTSTTNPPAAVTCTIPFSAPVLNGFSITDKGAVTFSWVSSETNVDKFSIRYGYEKDQLVYGEDNIPAQDRSVTLGSLQSGAHVWAIVTAWKNGCAEDSNELDPVVR